MEKIARKPSMDPAQERLRQNKATWNKDVSALVNDLIHFKKMMNGWPSKFYRERSKITEPIPADPATIIGSLAGDFQEIVNRGNALIQEQIDYSKNRRQKQPKQLNLPLNQPPTTSTSPTEEKPVDLTKQLALPGIASSDNYELVKLANKFENKYALETEASNPLTRFITRLMTPRVGFGEGARIRRLRRTLLDACAKTNKGLKKLQNEVVKSSKASVVNTHKLMNIVYNDWSIVARSFAMFKALAPKNIQDTGGPIETKTNEESKEQEPEVTNQGVTTDEVSQEPPLYKVENAKNIIADYTGYGQLFNANPNFQELGGIVDKIKAAPKANKVNIIMNSNIEDVYRNVITSLNQIYGTTGNTIKDIAAELAKKQKASPTPAAQVATASAEELLVQAQLRRWLGKTRHQLLPGSTSGSRLEIYRLISTIKDDLNVVMDLLEKGFDEQKLTQQLRKLIEKLFLCE